MCCQRGSRFASTQRPVVAISPDGRSFAYQTVGGPVSTVDGRPGRPAHSRDQRAQSSPFVSPDGQWVAYFAMIGGQFPGSSQLKKMAVTGGAPVILCAATAPFGASWAADNTILFGQRAGIMRLSANGGTPELVVRAAEGEQMYGPQLLPDGDSVLFSVTKEVGPNRWDGRKWSCSRCPRGANSRRGRGKRCSLSFDRPRRLCAARRAVRDFVRCETPDGRGRRCAARSKRSADGGREWGGVELCGLRRRHAGAVTGGTLLRGRSSG